MQKLLFQPFNQTIKSPKNNATHDHKKYGTSTTINTSSSSIQSPEDEYRKSAIKWLLEFDRKVTKDTNYLAVWYLQMLIKAGFVIKQSNWQLIAASIILFAGKMNQIYPPSISSIIKRCKSKYTDITTQSIIQMQGRILNHLDFGIAIQSPFNLICQLLKDKKNDIDECQKLMKIIIYNKDICFHDSETIAYAIIYLISRNIVDAELKGEYRQKVKIVAQKMYNFYKDVRKNYQEQREKQKEKNNSNNQMKLLNSSTSSKNLNSMKENQNSYQPFSTLIGKQNIKRNDQSGMKKLHSNDTSNLQRISSFKQIPKPSNLLGESTNLPEKQKKIFNCLSKDSLSYKNIYLYS